MAKKRRKQRGRRGEGYSQELPSGNWRALVPDGSGGYRSLGTYPTEEEADKARWRHHLAGREPLALPLGDWLDLWLVDHATRVRPNSLRTDRQMVETYLRPALSAIPLGQLDASRITHFLTTLQATAHEKLKAWKTLRKCLRANPAIPYAQIERVRSPKVRTGERRTLTWDEYHQLCLTADTWIEKRPYLGAMIRVGVEGCCRPSELLGLRLQDYANGIISIEQSADRETGVASPLKNDHSRRRFRLTGPARCVLDAWVASHPGGEPLFPNRWHKYHIYRNFRARVWVPLRTASGIPTDFGLYELRHTGISLLMAEGENILAVAKRAGHKDGTLILKRYGHVLPDGQDRLTDAFERNSTNPARVE